MTALRIAIAGLFALAVAMGIGRFAFTPILPMMLHDGVVDLPRASWLASSNYVGYLLGALLCTFDPWLRRRFAVARAVDATASVRRGLAATVLLTLAMALPWPAAWPALRFAAGIASAYVFVYSSGWCLAQLAARGAPALGGVMFVGPGAGIVASGLLASVMVSWQWRASSGWIVFALLAMLLSAMAWPVFRHENEVAGTDTADASRASATAAKTVRPRVHGRIEVATLAFAYGISGFGYIVTATFLPVIARAAIAGSPLIDLFWPIFGAGVMAGALIASRLPPRPDQRLRLAFGYLTQAIGIGIGIAWPTEAGFAIGSLLLGLPFTTLTFFMLQEVRRIRPHAAASTIGLVTAVWAIGQALGPPLVAAMLRQSGGDAHAAFQRSLVVAAVALVGGAAVFAAATRAWPARAPAPT